MSGPVRIEFRAMLLCVAATASQAQPVDAERARELAGLVMMIGSLQQMRDTCTHLYPSQTAVIRGFYEASAVPNYAADGQTASQSSRKCVISSAHAACWVAQRAAAEQRL